MCILDISELRKTFSENVVAVDDFSLQVEQGDFVVLVGPSGCGKTTTLRMIAGLEIADSGSIFLDNVDVTGLRPEKRDIAMVFQDYALYPHMTVFDNIAFPLKMKKVPKEKIAFRVKRICEILGISDLQKRKPRQLSGGQKQRVAMGRALVRNPKLFLMDEPLSNLDAKLRLQMRKEIASLHKELNATIVYVTHDQTEAMTLADKIVVMDKGKIIQVGSPQELYDEPQNIFVAEFIGSTPINVLKASLSGDTLFVEGQKTTYHLSAEQQQQIRQSKCDDFFIGIRPEDVVIIDKLSQREHYPKEPPGKSLPLLELQGNSGIQESLGHETIIHFTLSSGSQIRVRTHPSFLLKSGNNTLGIDFHKTIFFNNETFERIGYNSSEPSMVLG